MDASSASSTTGSSGDNRKSVLVKPSPGNEKCPDARSQSQHEELIRTTEYPTDKISEHGIGVRRAENMSSPVHLLPTEIWTKIFHYALPPEAQAQQWVRETLASVCRHWNLIVNNSPTLWSGICSGDSVGSILTALGKSQQASLDVYGSWDSPLNITLCTIAEVIGSQRQFLEVISSHRERWRSVELELFAPPSGPLASNKETNTLLEHLSVSVTSQMWPVNTPFGLFAGPKPRLRHLSLETAPIQWGTFSAPNLSVLRLSSIEVMGPSLSQLYDIVTACPDLEEVIVELISSFADSTPPNPPHLVHLHRLRKLEFKYIGSHAVQWLLEAMCIPPDCSVHLQEQVKGHPKDSLFPSHLTDLPEKCLSQASNITVIVPMGSVGLSSDGLWSLDLTLDNMDVVREVLLWLDVAEVSSKTENVPIEMEWSSSVRLKDGFFDPVCEFGNVRHITICSNFGADCPGTVKQGLTFSFPGLRELRIEDPTSQIVELVIFLLNERQAARKNDVSRDPLRMVIFDGEEGAGVAQRSAILKSETFRSLIRTATASDIQVWWYGKLRTRSQDFTNQVLG